MNRVRGRRVVVAASVTAGLWMSGPPASAEVGAPAATVQAIAADAQFLEYAPPPAAPGVVCLIDSGVDLNPDTTPILAGSYALQPGTDTRDELSKLNPPVEPGHHADGHGTYMAMIMAAPVNGWGMAGIAPTSVRVFNLKALAAGRNAFPFPVYANSVVECADRPAGVSAPKVVNLSIGSGTQPTAADVGAIQNAVADARSHDLNVVGAAGNNGGPVGYPAAASGVLAVGAADANPAALGVFCLTSDRGLALGVLAPGCGSQSEAGGGGGGLDVAFSDDGTPAWASGTSEASAIVSAVIASMRAYAPTLTATQVAGCVTSTSVNGGNLDAAAAFRACGLGAIVSQGLAAYQNATTGPPQLAASQAAFGPAPEVRIRPPQVGNPSKAKSGEPPWAARPRVLSVQFRARRLVVRVANVPRRARLRVAVEREQARGRFRVVATRTTTGRTATVVVSGWDRVAVLFVTGDKRSSVAYVRRST